MPRDTEIDQIANDWVTKLAELSPSFATFIGVPGGEDRLDDFSPQGREREIEESKKVLARLDRAKPVDVADEVTVDALRRDLNLAIEKYEARLYRRELNNIASPAQEIRDIFDLSPTATESDWRNLVGRMNAVREALAGYQQSLREGISNKETPAQRQVKVNIAQAKDIASESGFFLKFAAEAKTESGELPESLRADLFQAAKVATDAYRDFSKFLSEELMPKATEVDAVGRERYELYSRGFLGATIDLDATYEWGIEELNRMIEEQKQTANQVSSGASIEEAVAILDADPKRKLHGTDALRVWMQQKSDEAVESLSKSHFDIPDLVKRLECMIAPTQNGGIYYTPPTDDFSRPGRMWWSVPAGVTEFNTWRELTTVYHEGVPGHHLQVGQAVFNRQQLNNWRRQASWTSGHGEGWALYAERLMADLGYLDDPGDRLGMLDAQRMRAARVVLDLGVHLGKKKLNGEGVWDWDYALEFMMSNVNMEREFVEFEVNRYFGWAGQAPAYKVGQRIWEEIRDAVKEKEKESFDIKRFHKRALDLGGLGLDTLKHALLK